ncbi:MAG: M48 family metallopeptidase [Candidatus Merdivicinus sp.]|jgi:predicted metal-dependent hydrolase
MNYTLIRSKRKTLAVRILPGGIVEVRAPLRLSKLQIEQFLQQKADWIEANLMLSPPIPQHLGEGVRLPFLGTEYSLRLRENLPAGIYDGKLILPLSPFANDAEIRKAAENFYRQQAKLYIPPLIAQFSHKLGVECKGIRITGAKTRWGSCSAKSSLNFSWRLMAAPLASIEFVAAHELCHLLHFDHSAAFYSALAGILPDWKARHDTLKQFRQLCW